MNKWIKRILMTGFLFAMCLMPVSAYVDIIEQDDSYFVTDEAKVLDSSTEQYIVSKNQLLNETSGASIVIVTVDLLNADIVDYAYTLFNEWQLGDEITNNGILLLVSIGDEDYYCMIGRGLETLMTSDELQTILDEDLEPDFAAGNYQAGIRKVFDTLYQRCVQLYNVDENAASSASHTTESIFASAHRVYVVMQTILSIFVVVTILILLFALSARRRTFTHRPVTPPPPPMMGPSMHRTVYTHRPVHPSSHRTYGAPSSHSSRSSSFGSSASRSFSSRPSSSRSSSSFSARSGGSSRGAGAGRRK